MLLSYAAYVIVAVAAAASVAVVAAASVADAASVISSSSFKTNCKMVFFPTFQTFFPIGRVKIASKRMVRSSAKVSFGPLILLVLTSSSAILPP